MPQLVLGGNTVHNSGGGHLIMTEPNSVAAFAQAMLAPSAPSSSWAVDVGANVGMYAMLAAQLGAARVVAVEMQPGCAARVRCNLGLNGMAERVELHNEYVTADEAARPLDVPTAGCGVMNSPSAVAGRWPHGALLKENLCLERNGTAKYGFCTGGPRRTAAVPPLLLGAHLTARLPPNATIAVTKVDTEGFEVPVLEALRPVWPRLRDVVLELQPHAWRFHNTSLEVGLRTLSGFLAAGGYHVVSLPHPAPGEPIDVTTLDVCTLPLRPHDERPTPTAGLRRAARFDVQGFERFVRFAHERRLFVEVLFTRWEARCGDASGTRPAR